MIISTQQAVEMIRNGDVVAFPTETVYGLGADAKNLLAVKKTFELKGRPSDNPLIVHISSMEQLGLLVSEIPGDALKLAEAFWPGPLTLILQKKKEVPDIVTGGLKTVAVRMPDHPEALKLIEQTGPLTGPSANKSGLPSPTKPEHIEADYNGLLPVIDGGRAKLGLESTVLDLSRRHPVILRPGAISSKMIHEVIKKDIKQPDPESKEFRFSQTRSPGTRYTHYKPKASVKWISDMPSLFQKENYYIFHSAAISKESDNVHCYYRDYSSLAKDLYDHFRNADYLGCSQVLIEKLPGSHIHPMIDALKNRIQKASG